MHLLQLENQRGTSKWLIDGQQLAIILKKTNKRKTRLIVKIEKIYIKD